MLPAIATQDWCDRAAVVLSKLFDGAPVGVAIGEIDASGTFLRLESVGAAGAVLSAEKQDVIRRRFEMATKLGWTLGEPSTWNGPLAARLADLPVGLSWAAQEAGRQWANIGVSELLVGAATISPQRPGRVVIIEVGRPGGRPFEDADTTTLSGVMRAVARRAFKAFGPDPISSNRMLTPREQEVLSRLALGESVKEIAVRLDRSPHTVHDHVKALHRKLQASSRGALIARALGYLSADGAAAPGIPEHNGGRTGAIASVG
ncbi:MAG: response regulator transcription factor [Phycisphaerales bacterium]|nr:response regulator transcription factor [Phycisphaerales bacterium]